jgi:hypothetical protein
MLSLLNATPFGLGNNQPGLLFVLLALGFGASFYIAARIQWRGSDVPAESGGQGADDDTGQVTRGFPGTSLGQPLSRALVDVLNFVGVAGGACLGFIAIVVMAWNGIVNNDAWLLIGTTGGAFIGGCITTLVVWRLRSAARHTR